MDNPFIENSSDFDASYDSAHKEKICFCIKIRALIISVQVCKPRTFIVHVHPGLLSFHPKSRLISFRFLVLKPQNKFLREGEV